jgi:tRNA A-37 threonylcarbamoyl transferase component Bud32
MKLDTVIAKREQKTVYRDGNYTIKVFNEGYNKADILNEALNQARVEETGLNIPKIEEVTKIEGKWSIVSQFIPGKTLGELMKENPDKFDEYLNQFVDLQLLIQSKRAPLLNRIKDKMHRKISLAELDENTKYDLQTRLEGMKTHEKICHGDFNPSNVIIHETEGVPYVIDWAHVTQGNAAADAARTFLLFSLAGKDDIAEKYMKLFCEKSKTDRLYVNRWLPIVAASQSVKGKPEERDFLLKWAQVVDYE